MFFFLVFHTSFFSVSRVHRPMVLPSVERLPTVGEGKWTRERS
ncbi:hypothetical protein OIU77_007175 [Salix suchowensis]|uniref:Uncharacterized protein n=1 Tax=Salix suchowensis TaxID=1278906 RepID=A0ABQ9AF69_9ROSI|nr:hypothetical protein OIU77_007175 [Salix suchowensis]